MCLAAIERRMCPAALERRVFLAYNVSSSSFHEIVSSRIEQTCLAAIERRMCPVDKVSSNKGTSVGLTENTECSAATEMVLSVKEKKRRSV